jgi:hypothetical protein
MTRQMIRQARVGRSPTTHLKRGKRRSEVRCVARDRLTHRVREPLPQPFHRLSQAQKSDRGGEVGSRA